MKFKAGDYVVITSHEFTKWNNVRTRVDSINTRSHFPVNIIVPGTKTTGTICMMENELMLDKEYNIIRILNKIDNG